MAENLTYRFNTELSPEDEQLYQSWKAANRQGFNDEMNYDMRGAWLEGSRGDSNMHFPDRFKKPNHPTFSTESKYYGMDGVMSTNPLQEHEPTLGGNWYYNMFAPTGANLDNIKTFLNIEPDNSKKYISGVDNTAAVMNPYYKEPTRINFDQNGMLANPYEMYNPASMSFMGNKNPYAFIGTKQLSKNDNTIGIYSKDVKRPANGKIYSMYTAEYNTPNKTYSISHGKGIKGDTRTMINYEKRF